MAYERLTIAQVLERVFPRGTRAGLDDSRAEDSDGGNTLNGLRLVPNWPPDVFALAGYLLELSGAYHRIAPGSGDTAEHQHPEGHLVIDESDLLEWKRLADLWAAKPTMPSARRSDVLAVPEEIQNLWDVVIRHSSNPVRRYRPSEDDLELWRALYGLLVVTDEACCDVGFVGKAINAGPSTQQEFSWIVETVDRAQQSVLGREARRGEDASGHDETPAPVIVRTTNTTIAIAADLDVVCVQPKARTPRVGCTPRTMSHNLSVLPPRGMVNAHWQRLPFDLSTRDEEELNLLLLPYPFKIDPSWFSTETVVAPEQGTEGWGWFELRQEWLSNEKKRADLIDFTVRLARDSSHDFGPIHGIVFPEYALDWKTHRELAGKIATDPTLSKHAEFLVSGSSQNCLVEKDAESSASSGNFALVSQFGHPLGGTELVPYTSSRPKHHRWQLDTEQIANYGLGPGGTFAKNMRYWERIGLPPRAVHANVFRKSSIFATMICEDLARSDPCHELLRSLGPNVIFVLLMDGPQIPTRWSARYATTLAEDPGSSVLTLTSLGMIERVNAASAHANSYAVGLWKDDSGITREIYCPPGNHGVFVSLKGSRADEMTLDGRPNSDTCRWRFASQHPVALGAGLDFPDRNYHLIQRVHGRRR